MLSNYILENGHVVEKTSTSLTCFWNKAKKQNKTPRKLHESMYESGKQKHPDDLHHWDPRSSEHRRQFNENLEQQTSLFVRELQTINTDKRSLWETLIKVTYEDFVLDDDDKLYYKYLVRNFESCLADNVANIF